MTDLTQLFLTHKPAPSSQFLVKAMTSQQKPPVANLFGTRSFPNLAPEPKSTLQTKSFLNTPIKRTEKQSSKMTINSQSMSQEVQYFKKLYFKQFTKKAILLLIPLLLFQFSGLVNSKICFEAMLFGLSLLALETEIIENRSLKIFINTLPILTYLALFYDILTLSNFAGHYHVTLADVPAFIVSLIATINFVFFRKAAYLVDQQPKIILTDTKYTRTLINLTKKYINRVRSSLKLKKYSISLNVVISLGFIIYCMINWKTTLFSSTLNTVPIGFLVYALVDFLVFSIEFVSREIHLFNLKQKFYQIEVCVGLLRIKNKSDQYQKIHQRCLIELARQLKKHRDYLETPVKVNYAINSYRDIFEIYTIEDLNNLASTLSDITAQVAKNNKIIESTKTMKQDIFIYIKKFMARINNNCQVYRFLAELHKKKVIFLIMAKLASQEPLKNRVTDIVEEIISNVSKVSTGKSFFDVAQVRLNCWKEDLHKLKGDLQEGSTKSVFYVSERDQNGWCHYKRRNPNDILEN